MRGFLLLALLLAPGEPEAVPEAPLGAASAFDLSGGEEILRLEEGVRLRREPDPLSAPLATVDAAVELPVLERRGDWARVRHGGWTGWVPAGGREPEGAAGRAASLAVQPAAAAPEREIPDPELLSLALSHLTDPLPVATIGPFPLHTDARRERLVTDLRRVAAGLEDAYENRFGLRTESPRGAVVLYASEAAYRAYAQRAGDPLVQSARGHARAGVASLFVGSDGDDLLPSLLVHEATHLLNREAIGANLPAWLEEGLANDLASCRIEPDGTLALGSWGGSSTVRSLAGRRGSLWIQQRGALVSRRLLLSSWRRRALTPLPELLELPWGAFVAPERRTVHYNQATAFVRYLLDGGDPDLAAGFRVYLGELSTGAVPDLALLERSLGRPVEVLARGFDTWLARQAVLETGS